MPACYLMMHVPLRITSIVAASFAALSAAAASLGVSGATGTLGRDAVAHPPAAGHYEYVVDTGVVDVYSIDRANRLIQQLRIPQLDHPAVGVVASPRTGRLYVSFGGQGGPTGSGSLLAYDLLHRRVLWVRQYPTGVDSLAITPNGRKIYLPTGEFSADSTWQVVDAATGRVTGAIQAGEGPHNTIMGPDGRFVYLAAVNTPFLEVANTASDQVVKKIGPLNPPGVRPFTIDRSQSYAFTTARSFLGFQVSSIRTGKVLYTVPVPGFSWDQTTFKRTPDHGISLSPDGRQLYLIDTPNGYVHVFDLSGLPKSAPHDVADIKLQHPPPNDGWLQHSSNGQYVYVGRAGDVIDTRSRRVVAYLPPLQQTADFLEIDWRNGRPVATTSRYGDGYTFTSSPARTR